MQLLYKKCLTLLLSVALMPKALTKAVSILYHKPKSYTSVTLKYKEAYLCMIF